MAWTSIVTHGDTVHTPHGIGTVRRISEAQGTAQVEVNGQLFEVPMGQVAQVREAEPQPKEGGQPVPEKKKAKPIHDWDAAPGKRVQSKTGKKHGEIKEVTQRSVKGQWDNGDKFAYPKKGVQAHLDHEQKDEVGKGDRVKVTNNGKSYTTYPEKAQELGATNYQEGHHFVPDNGVEATVVNKDRDGINLIETDDGKQYLVGEKGLEKIESKEEEKPKQEQPEKPTEQAAKDAADDLYGILQLKKKLEEKIDNEVEGEMQELRELAKKNQTLEVKVGDKVNEVKGLKHKQLEQLINYAALRLSPLLVGMAGTGKTHAGEQTSRALGLPFYSMSVGAQTSKSDIIGYMAANGQYVSTHFRQAYEHGGVFLMDEIDAGNANVLIQINAALSNGLCAFPDAMVQRHDDFVFIASANTFGNGANRQYVGRNQLDAATLDRFAVIEWLIDDDLESQLTTGINGKAWYMAVRAAREYVAEKNIRALISPRATQKGSKLLHVGQDLKEVIHATMLGSVPEDKKQDVEQVATTIFEKFASEVPGQLPKQVNPEVGDLLKEMPF